jgi:glycosyltransferase involved in cell wall biosynthesis
MADHLGHDNGRIHGGTTYFLNTIPALKSAGFEVDALFLSAPHPAAAELTRQGMKPTFLSLGKYDLGSYRKIRRAIQAKPNDVVHLHSFKSHLLGRFAVRAAPIASVVHVHDENVLKQPLKYIMGLQGPSTDALIGVSKTTTEFGSAQYKVARERCFTIPNGIDIAPFVRARATAASKVREEIGVRPERKVIVIAGRLTPAKGQPAAFKAMADVVERCPDSELWVVGDGPAADDYRTMVRDLDIGSSVRFLGQRMDMPHVFSSADLAIVPSRSNEAFGLVALEASAAGLPVIAFEGGGIISVVRDNETGLVVPNGDVRGLARAILSLLQDDARLETLGRGAALRAESFTVDIHVANLATLYRRLLLGTDHAAV